MSASSGSRVVDLTLPISEDHPAWWPTCQPFRHKIDNYFTDLETPVSLRSARGPFLTNMIVMDEHTGTHMDAPAHFIPPLGSGLPNASHAGSLTADKIPLNQTMGPLVIVDVRDVEVTRPGTSPPIGRDLVERWERSNRAIEPGDVVVFQTGWDRFYRAAKEGSGYVHDVVITKTEPGWPAPDVECVRALIVRGVRCIGTDAPSVGAAHDGAPAHVEGLSRSAVFIECLANLDEVPAVGADFIFLPLHILRASGVPGRAIALLEQAR